MEQSAEMLSWRNTTSRGVLIGGVFVLLIIGIWTMLFTSEFKKSFTAMGVDLPVPTSGIVSISPTVYAAAFALTIATLIVKEFVIINKRLTLTINVMAAIAGFIWFVFLTTALYLPFSVPITYMNS